MASLEFVYKHRFLVLLWSLLEILLFSAIVYGWAALCVVLKEEDFFVELCELTDEGNSTLVSKKCDKFITERLNLVFLTGVISFNATGIVSGAFLDRFGPRKTRLLSSILFGLTFLFLVLADKDRPDWIFPGIFTLSAAGITLLLPVFQVANMFEGSKSVVISLFNGAVDSSSVVLLFCKLVYDAGVSLHLIVIAYFIFAIISILMLTFILPPHSITLERLQDIPQYDNANDEHEGSPLFEPEDGEEKGKNSNVQKTNGKSEEDPAPSLLSQMLAPEYIFTVLVLSGYSLRLWFYVGNLNSYLEFMSGNDKSTVSYYTNWFGVYQFTGFISAPLVGLPMDWKPKKKQNQKTDFGFVAGYVLTSIIALILNILVLVPVLPAQYATFIMEVMLRSFNYAVFTAFLIHKFPLVHFGKLYGVGHLISSIIDCLQYGLFTVVEDDLDKDPFWVNASLLVMCLLLNIQPVFLWIKEKRQEEERLRLELIQG